MLSGENVLVPPAEISLRFRKREFSAVLDANIVNQIAVTREFDPSSKRKSLVVFEIREPSLERTSTRVFDMKRVSP